LPVNVLACADRLFARDHQPDPLKLFPARREQRWKMVNGDELRPCGRPR
jgi:hypothetical protein